MKISALIQSNTPGFHRPTNEPQSQYRFGYTTGTGEALDCLGTAYSVQGSGRG